MDLILPFLKSLKEKVLMSSLRLYKIPPIRRKLSEKYDSLVEFCYNYMKSHTYISRVFVAGMYVNRFYPNKPNNYKEIQQVLKRKVSEIFRILKKLGIVEQFNVKVVRVNQEKLNSFSLDDIRSYVIKN